MKFSINKKESDSEDEVNPTLPKKQAKTITVKIPEKATYDDVLDEIQSKSGFNDEKYILFSHPGGIPGKGVYLGMFGG